MGSSDTARYSWGRSPHGERVTALAFRRLRCVRVKLREQSSKTVAQLRRSLSSAASSFSSASEQVPATGADATDVVPTRGFCPACARETEWGTGPNGRAAARCTLCQSLERHRFLAELLRGLRLYVRTADHILEFAPQPQIQRLLRQEARSGAYVGIDPFDLRYASLAGDGCLLPFGDATFDLLLSFHVLEHIPDDARAIAEMARTMRPGGLALVQVPRRVGQPTEEDPDAPPEERARRFGQDDHVRFYGDDLEDRLAAGGLRADFFEAKDLIGPKRLARCGIPANNPIWICRRG